MEPFLLTGGEVGPAIKVWRDLSDAADAEKMDEMMTKAVSFLRSKLDA
jgi:D-psicose/D-tagatose/L-ribulose 3-epimerase